MTATDPSEWANPNLYPRHIPFRTTIYAPDVTATDQVLDGITGQTYNVKLAGRHCGRARILDARERPTPTTPMVVLELEIGPDIDPACWNFVCAHLRR